MGEAAVSTENIDAMFREQKDLVHNFFTKLDYEQIHRLAEIVRPGRFSGAMRAPVRRLNLVPRPHRSS